VDVEGQVQKPGVYKVSDGARLQDALIAAGGMSSIADREYISKHLNLAQKVVDGGKIYIPGIDEKTTDTPVSIDSDSNISSTNTLGDNSGLININSSSAEQLDTLPKVGAVTAQKIISGRPYISTDELVSKKILGQKTYDGLKDKITAE
jgi:competence protein ComEA